MWLKLCVAGERTREAEYTRTPHQDVGKIASCFTLLTQITRLKVVNSEIKSEDQSSYLERYSPKGPCHLDESSMSHTLAQKQSSYTGQGRGQ